MVKKLFPGQVIAPEQVAKNDPRTVDFRSLIGGKEENEEIVHQQEYHHEPEDKAHVLEADMADGKAGKADDHQAQQNTGIVGQHTGKGEQQEKHQLGGTRQGVDHAFAGNIAHDRITALGHAPAPPCQNR